MDKNLKNILLVLFCCFGYIYPVVAQSGNPFEIVGRENTFEPTINTTTTTSSSTILDTNAISSDNAVINPTIGLQNDPQENMDESITEDVQPDANNPFEIIRNTNVNISPIEDPVQKKKTVLKKEKKKSGTKTNNLLFWLLTTVLIGLAFFITIFRNYLTKIYRSFFNHNILRLSHREQRSFIDFPYAFLYSLYFINMSIFMFLGLTKFYPNHVADTPSTLLQITGSVIGIYLVKHFVLNFLDYVFKIKPEMGLYNFTIMVFNNVLGVVLVPLNFAIAFASPGLAKALIIIGLLAVAGVFMFRSLRSFLLAMKIFSFHKFHFFIYLCAVEIAPVIVLIKHLMLQNGIQ